MAVTQKVRDHDGRAVVRLLPFVYLALKRIIGRGRHVLARSGCLAQSCGQVANIIISASILAPIRARGQTCKAAEGAVYTSPEPEPGSTLSGAPPCTLSLPR